nr:penicillin acylase family protein [Pseudoalteromonas sp. MMG007]
MVPILIISFGLFQWLGKSLPLTKGEQTVAGITSPVSVGYDSMSIPTIKASNDLDAFYTLGFLHAKNRLWQMEMNRRLAAGRLSEVLGESALQSDILMRTLRLSQNAENMEKGLSEKDKVVLHAYVDGVNEGINSLSLLPPEYLLTGFKPEPWTIKDSMLYMQLMTYQLSGNMPIELQSGTLLQTFGREKFADLFPQKYLSDDEVLTELAQQGILFEKLNININEDALQSKPYLGSNAWVVSGSLTESSLPILANDPHLNNSIPSVFYLTHLIGSKINVSGATFPGLPFVVAGKNKHVSWGVTSMMADTQDIYLERINPKNKFQYEVDGSFHDMQIFHEEINIRNGFLRPIKAPYKLNVRLTHRGPVISDVIGTTGGYAYSLRWTGSDQDGGTFSSYLKMNYAENAEQFMLAMKEFVAPVQNFVFADDKGNIGRLAPGKYPIRSKENGEFPSPGWLSKNDWKEWIPYSQWPKSMNPESGYIVAANNNVLNDNNYPYYISSDWAPGYRAERIEALINKAIIRGEQKLSVRTMVDIQFDVKHPLKDLMLDAVKNTTLEKEKHKYILSILSTWNGDMDFNGPQPAIFAAWLAHFTRLVFQDDLKSQNIDPQRLSILGQEESIKLIERILTGESQLWCDYSYGSKKKDCSQILLLSLEHAINELDKLLGGEIEDWDWSEIHMAHYAHFPFSDSRYLAPINDAEDKIWAGLFHRKIASKGAGHTVSVATVSYDELTRFDDLYGTSYRQIIDLGKPELNLFGIATGQSGNAVSPHYDDFLSNIDPQPFVPMRKVNDFSLKLVPQKNKDN